MLNPNTIGNAHSAALMPPYEDDRSTRVSSPHLPARNELFAFLWIYPERRLNSLILLLPSVLLSSSLSQATWW